MNNLRIAIIGSPRSGNTWIRCVLGEILTLEQLAVHNYIELENIPDRCIVQLHWYREPNFQKFLRDRCFRTVVVARHPLDVLVSILNFICHEPLTARWLEGNAEIPRSLAGQAPTSQDFVKYATSWGAENVLGVSYQWWHDPDAIRVRYEELIHKPREALLNLARVFDPAACDEVGAIDRFDLPFFQRLPNRHGWQGTPGLWRQLVVYSDARAIYRRHRRIFEVMGYSVRPYLLTRTAALRRWRKLTRDTGPVCLEPQVRSGG